MPTYKNIFRANGIEKYIFILKFFNFRFDNSLFGETLRNLNVVWGASETRVQNVNDMFLLFHDA